MTSLGFSIFSRYEGDGISRARRDIDSFNTAITGSTRNLNSWSGRLILAAKAAAVFGPALLPIAAHLTAIAGAATAMASTVGAALGVYGAAMKGAIASTLSMAEAGKKLAPSQKEFMKALNDTTSAWKKFIAATQDKTLATATHTLRGLTAGIALLKPIVDALHPSLLQVSKDFENWMKGDSAKNYANLIKASAVPALNNLIAAGKDVINVLGDGFRAFLPSAVNLSKSLREGAASLREWSDSGGFQRFLEYVKENDGPVREFFRALGDAFTTIGKVMRELGPLSLGITTTILQLVAALPPEWIANIVKGFIAWKAAMLGLAIISTVISLVHGLAAAWFVLNLAFSASAIGLVVLAIAALIAGIILLIKNWDTVSAALKTAWNATWNAMKIAVDAVWQALQVAWHAVTGAFITAWQAVSGTLTANWNATWNAIKLVVDTIWMALQVAWNAVVNAFILVWNTVSAALVTAWTTVWNAIQTAAQFVWTALQLAWQTFITALQTIWTTVSTALSTAWQAVWTAIQTVAQAIWTALQTAWNAFITALQTIWTTVSTALQAAWQAVWNAIRTAAETVWNALQTAWNAFINGLQAIWSSVSSALQAAWSAVWNAIQTVATTIWNALQAAWNAFLTAVQAIWNTISSALQAAWQAVWTAIQTVAQTIWTALQTAWNAFLTAVQTIWNTVSSALQAAWQAAWNFIRTTAETIWNALQAAWQAFLNLVRSIWDAFWSGLSGAWETAWNWARTTAETIWNAIRELWNTITSAIRSIWDAFWSGLSGAWETAWNWARTTAETIWNAVRELWNTFTGAIRSAWDAFWSAFSGAWEDAWNAAKGIADRIWHEIGEIIEKAINAVIGIINGLIKGFNKITEFLSIDVSISEIGSVNLNFAEGGTVGLTPYMNGGVAEFAHGGAVNLKGGGTLSGYAPGRDTVPAVLSRGEGVLVPEAVRGLGGAGFVHSANHHFSKGRAPRRGAPSFGHFDRRDSMAGGRIGQMEHASHPRNFAKGGIVGGVQHFAVGGITAAALARAGVPLSMITQGEYSTGVAASAGTHDGGGVVDIASTSPAIVAALRAAGFAAWARGPAQGMSPHIHAVLMSHPDLSPAARAQVASFLAGGDGLGVGGGGDGGGGIDILGMLKDHIGKILNNVYKGISALAGIGGGIADFFGMGGDDDEGNGGLFGTGIGPDFGPDVVQGVGNVAEAVTGLGGTMAGMLGRMVLSMLDKGSIAEGLSDATDKLDGFGGIAGKFGEIAVGFGTKIVDEIMPDFLMEKKEEAGPIEFAAGGTGTGAWAAMAALALARAGISPGQLPNFLALMMAESGGNPMAINLTDSNAAMGQASRGLMQVIPSTFAAYRDPSLSSNIFDPLANMTAAARYIKAVYGGIVPGSPYAEGTNNATPGMHLVGEEGPELVTSPGYAMFGGGERVFTASQTASMMAPAAPAPAVSASPASFPAPAPMPMPSVDSLRDILSDGGSGMEDIEERFRKIMDAAKKMQEVVKQTWNQAVSAATAGWSSMSGTYGDLAAATGSRIPASMGVMASSSGSTWATMTAQAGGNWAAMRDGTYAEAQAMQTVTMPAANQAMATSNLNTWTGISARSNEHWAGMRDGLYTEAQTMQTATMPAANQAMATSNLNTWVDMAARSNENWTAMRDITFAEALDMQNVKMPTSHTTMSDSNALSWNTMNTDSGTTWGSMRDTTFAEANDFIAVRMPQWGEEMNQGVSTSFQNMNAATAESWAGMQDATRAPVNWIISNAYNNGLARLWNAVAAVIFADGAQTLPSVATLAKGGPVRGPGTGTSDSVPAMLSSGEHVWTAAEVRKAGGHQAVANMRSMILSGNPVQGATGGPGFARGGWLAGSDTVSGSVSAAVPTGLKRGMMGDVVNPILDGIDAGTRSSLGGNAFRKLGAIADVLSPSKWMRDYIAKDDELNRGGEGAEWARAQVGKPYVLGTFGSSFDCSTYMSGIATMIRDGVAAPWFTTHPFHGGAQSPLPGWERNLDAPFQIGITSAGIGHTGGTIDGENFEATPPRVRSGPAARGAGHSMYQYTYGFAPSGGSGTGIQTPGGGTQVNPADLSQGIVAFDRGGWIPKGYSTVYNGTGEPELATPASEFYALADNIEGLSSRVEGHECGAHFAEGAIKVDLRGASEAAVRRFETEALPKMRMMLQQKIGKRP